MKAIVYSSNTGSSKRYAEMLSVKTGCAAYDINGCDSLSGDAEVIFIGWIMAGMIQGLDAARQRFSNIKAVCAVGMMKSESQDTAVKEKNHITEEYFSLSGAFDMNKLKGMHKMMMGMMVNMLKKKLKESPDPKAGEVLQKFTEGFDMVNEAELDPIIEFMK